jgi:ATP synthase protein I
MTQHPVVRGRAFVARVHGLMALLALVMALVIAVVVGITEALAAFAGAAAVLLPQNFVARRLLQPVGARNASQFVLRLWIFQAVKWGASALLFAAALVYFKAQAGYVLTGFIVIFQGLWIAPLILARTGKS